MQVDNQTLVIVLGFALSFYQTYKNGQIRTAQHIEQIAATNKATIAANNAYAEANNVNVKMAGLQESANRASGIPTDPYVAPSQVRRHNEQGTDQS